MTFLDALKNLFGDKVNEEIIFEEPKQDPTPEPTPEPKQDPTPEPTQEPKQDPTPEPTPEPNMKQIQLGNIGGKILNEDNNAEKTLLAFCNNI